MKQKNRIRTMMAAAAGLICILCLCAMGVYAAEMPYTVEYEYSSSSVHINGTIGTEGEVFFQVLKPGRSFGDVTDDDILYHNQVTAADGAWAFDMEYGSESGECEAVLVTNAGEDRTQLTLNLVSFAKLEESYRELNLAANEGNAAEFTKVVNDKRDLLNFRFELTDGKSLTDDQLSAFMAYVAANPLKTENENVNGKIFNTYMTAYELNRGGIANIGPYIPHIFVDDDAALTKYVEAAATDSIRTYFTEKLTRRSITDLASFENEFKRALIYTVIRYAGGYGDVKDILAKYGSIVGITSAAPDSVYRGIVGKDFTGDSQLKTEFNNLLDKAGSSGPSGGGGMGGGGGSYGGFTSSGPSINGNADYVIEHLPDSEADTPIAVTFNDIDGVDWATEAILALADKGIINGVAPNRFEPDRSITREEFAKILVGAMGLADSEYSGNAFVDVPDDAWYCSYVNIARENNILQGVEIGVFGVEQTITREDMATMIYNALSMRGVPIEKEKLTFEDADQISDYAKPAVAALFKLGAINGVSETEFRPKGETTRAQAAKVIYIVLDQLQ